MACGSCFYHIQDLGCTCHYLDLNRPKLLASGCLVAFITAIHFHLVFHTLTSPIFNVSRIDWPILWRSHLVLLVVLYCCVPFIVYQNNLELISRFVCWPMKLFIKKQPADVYFRSMLATPLSSCSWRSSKRITLLVSRVKINTGAKTFHSCAPSL